MPTIKTYARRLRRRRHPLRYLVARLLWQSSIVLYVPITINRDLYKLRFFPSKLSADFWSDPALERVEDRFLQAYLKPGDIVVDVGANIGSETLTASFMVGNTGKIFAIEPQPRIFTFLQKNIALNGFTNVVPINVAVDQSERVVTFSKDLLDTSNQVIQGVGQEISAKPLDSILEPFAPGRIDLIKIDVEGYEYNVLSSAPRTLQKTACVYFEHIAKYFGRYNHTEDEIFNVLIDAGLQHFRLRGDDKNMVAIRDVDEFCRRMNGRLELIPVV